MKIYSIKSDLRKQILVFSITRIVFNTMLRMVYFYLGEFSRGMEVDLAALSRAFTLRSIAGGLSPILAFFADSRGRKLGILFGLTLVVLAAGALTVLPTYIVFVFMLVVATVGYHIFVPSMQAYLGDHVDFRQRAYVLALTELGWSLSLVVGVPLAGWLIQRYGWSSPFPIFTVLSLVGLIALGRILPGDQPRNIQNSGVRKSFQLILSSPTAILGLGVSFFMVTGNELVNLVFGLWLDNAFGLKITALGMLAAAIGVAEFGGESLVGLLVDRFGKIRGISAGLVFNSLAMVSLIFFGGYHYGALVSLFVFYFSFEFTLVSSLPLMTELLPDVRASLMAVNIAMFSLGRALGAWMGGLLYTFDLGKLPQISPNALAAILFNLLGLLVLFILSRRLSSKEVNPLAELNS